MTSTQTKILRLKSKMTFTDLEFELEMIRVTNHLFGLASCE
jgi:hypothetical protein